MSDLVYLCDIKCYLYISQNLYVLIFLIMQSLLLLYNFMDYK